MAAFYLNYPFKDHRVQSARHSQLTVGKSGKPNLIICVVHSGSLIQAAVQPRTWVCSWENKPNCANGDQWNTSHSSWLLLGSQDTQTTWQSAMEDGSKNRSSDLAKKPSKALNPKRKSLGVEDWVDCAVLLQLSFLVKEHHHPAWTC